MSALIGQLNVFALNFTPTGWLPCDGRTLSIRDNTALFALIGANHGGDGRIDFALPDLREQAPAPGTHWAICVQGEFPSRP